jgi:hypothetical protein
VHCCKTHCLCHCPAFPISGFIFDFGGNYGTTRMIDKIV